MGIAEENKQRLIDYFEAGCHEGAQVVGVEVEHFVIFDDGSPVTYGGEFGVRDVLAFLTQEFPVTAVNEEGELVGCSNADAGITLEPAAQIEISIAPFASIRKVGEVYDGFRALVDPFLAEHGARLVTQGYHPTRKALDLPLIPKQRYRFMNEHFQKLGTHGERMMRTSASTQVSVDYTSEADAVRKVRIASALAPVLSAIADNTHAFEGAPSATPLIRLETWRQVDPARAGVIPGVFDEGFGFSAYADWQLATSPIFVTRAAADDPEGPALRPVGLTPAGQVYGDAVMGEDDVEHLLSMFWPDVRLKRFVEIRPADSLPCELMMGYAALIKALFYSDEALSILEAALGVEHGVWKLKDSDIDAALEAVRAQGYEAEMYGSSLRVWIELLFDLAERLLEADERPFLEPLRVFALGKEWQALR